MRDRKDGLRFGEGWIRPRPRTDGGVSHQAGWLDDGRQRTKTFATRDEAEDYLRDVRRRKRDGRYQPPSRLTVKDAVEQWLARGVHDWSTNTQGAYRLRAENYVYPTLGDLKAEALTRPRVQHWVDGLAAKGYAPATVDAAATLLKSALKELCALGALASNPAQGVRLPAIKPTPKPTWTPEETQRVADHLADDPFWLAVVRVALMTGMRPGELCALQWSDVDAAAGAVRVRRTLTRDARGHEVLGTTTKGKRERAVALPPLAAAALASWRTAQKARRLAARDWRDLGFIFDRGNGDWLPTASLRAGLAEIERACGVRLLPPHGLRHTNATQGLENGEHPAIVKERLGHRSIATTIDTYSHVSIDLQKAAAEALEKRIFGDPDAEKRADA